MATKSSKKTATKKAAKSSKPAKKGAAAGASKRAAGKWAAPAQPTATRAAIGRNGFRSFAFHRLDKGAAPIMAAIHPMGGAARGPRAPGAAAAAAAARPGNLTLLDAETAARHFLTNALDSEQLPAFTAGDVSGEKSEFKLISTEFVPLTGNLTVKFCQHYRKTPIYGSLVTVELDKKNELVAINSALSEPVNIDPVASVSPAEVLKQVRERAGYVAQHLDATPRLYYYFDRAAQRWRLVYITRDVVKLARTESAGNAGNAADAGDAATKIFAQSRRMPHVFDYVVDAHTGEMVTELPRSQSAQSVQAKPVQAHDGLGQLRTIKCSQNSAGTYLYDPELNLHTHDFRYGNVSISVSKLPGEYVVNPPDWDAAAVSAHANAAEVVAFMKEVLKRNGVDNLGGPIRSSINCVEAAHTKVWDNAMWYKNQMMYGQSQLGDEFRSWAVAKDIVAHEITHGLTDYTARLEYLGESGALNESYSDIFGVLISNFDKPNVANWNWLIGEDLTSDGTPLRDMKNPTRFDQPAHMDDYIKFPNTEAGDWGGVHTNSGIHNKAAYNILTAKDSKKRYLIKPREVAALFYLALTQHLTRTSRFADSRRGVELAARSLFANQSNGQAKLKAVGRAFDKIGIVQA